MWCCPNSPSLIYLFIYLRRRSFKYVIEHLPDLSSPIHSLAICQGLYIKNTVAYRARIILQITPITNTFVYRVSRTFPRNKIPISLTYRMLEKAKTATDPQPRGGWRSNMVLHPNFIKHVVRFLNLRKAEIVYHTFCVFQCAFVQVCMCLLACAACRCRSR